jgi:hypothetical protein
VHFVDARDGWVVGEKGTILATTDGGASWQKRPSGVGVMLGRVYFADAKNGWTVGQDGTILTITVPNTSEIAAAADPQKMLTALKSIGLDDRTIGQPLVEFKSIDSDVNERGKRVDQDQQALATYAPKINADTSTVSLLNNPMFLSNLNRVGITIYAFFAVTIIVAVYRYSMRLSTHYDACADALELSDGSIDARFHQLIRSLSPAGIDFGKAPRSPVDQAAEMLQAALRGGRQG